jgi:2'-5' RNA ligase
MTTRPIRHRYFFAIRPDGRTARRTHAFAESALGPEGLLRADRLHVTLAITGDFEIPQPALAEALLHAGSAVRARPFDLVLDRRSTSPRTIALRPAHVVPELRALGAAIFRAMAREGIALREGWSFSPHMTLAYRPGRPSQEAAQEIGWPVTEFALVHSLVGATRHETLGRWPLEPMPEAQLSLFAA